METVDKLNLKSLRIMADKMGVAWSKKDDEAVLRKKVAKQRDAAESTASTATAKSGTDFDTKKRAPFTIITDPRTKKPVRDPTGCFGYFFLDTPTKDDVDCKAVCLHWKPCKVLSKDASKVLDMAVAVEEESNAKEEAAEVDDDDLKMAEAAKGKGKKAKKEEAKSILTEEKRVGVIELDTMLKVEFDLDYALAIDDDDLRKFYKRVAKKIGEGKQVSAEDLTLIFCETQGLDDPEPVINEFIPQMVGNEEFSIVG